ncbi:chymotrypsin-2-like [Diachasma alloeum]|uniref:chymotrypsin-2-like n=1 Tax=Diachasma alloeum TaxID=454923 RepID=UPI00073822F1|nr:chymotrypsin-2-like [Diachasma alloeum]
MAFTLLFFTFTAIIIGTAAKPPQKILNGNDANLGEFPWMVSIQYEGLHICGGAIISERHILTAAHCFVGKYPAPYNKDITVVTGSVDKYSGGQTHEVATVIPHENFQRGPTTRWRNDIALVTLTDRIRFSRTQQKIDLPSSVTTRTFQAQLSGFGLLTRGLLGESTVILKKSDVSVLTNEECNKKNGRVFDDQICGFDGIDRGFCNGDSGSPLVYNYQVIGIVSFSPSCGIGYPDVYTRVYSFLEWIESAKSA